MTNDELKQSTKFECHKGCIGPKGPEGLMSYDRPIFEPYVERMIIEYKQLSEKVDKLEAFLDSSKFEDIDPVMQLLKISQYNTMCSYLGILMLELKHEGVEEKWI